jgi:hypothetical protein
MNHEHTWIHKIHHGPNVRETTTFPLIVFSMIIHGGCIQMSFCPGALKLKLSKLSKLGLLELWRVITSCSNLQLRWSFKKCYNSHQELSNDMWHVTYTHVFQSDSWFLMSESQIGTLTPNPFFGHNLCFKYSNGSCKLILRYFVVPSISPM